MRQDKKTMSEQLISHDDMEEVIAQITSIKNVSLIFMFCFMSHY